MTFDEAVVLARQVQQNAQFLVIAVGRFRLVSELLSEPGSDHPWGVSVVARDQPSKPHSLWSTADWQLLQDYCKPLPDNSTQPQPPKATAPARRDEHITRQPMLF